MWLNSFVSLAVVFLAMSSVVNAEGDVTKAQEILNKFRESHVTPADHFFYHWAKKDNLEKHQVSMTPVETHSSSKLRGESSTMGWLYSNGYNDKSCSTAIYQDGYATNQCYLTETYQGTQYSVMITCNNGKTTFVLFKFSRNFSQFYSNNRQSI